MLDDDQLEHHLKELIMDVCEVMHRKGFDVVPIGAIMRLVGVDAERARAHDDEYFDLGTEFEKMIESRKKIPKSAPSGVTLH